MFKLQAEPTFWSVAQIPVPGQSASVPLDVEFKWYGRGQLRDFLAGIKDRDDLDILSDVIVGWKGVDQSFSRDALALLIDNYPRSADALFDAFKGELLKAKEKN